MSDGRDTPVSRRAVCGALALGPLGGRLDMDEPSPTHSHDPAIVTLDPELWVDSGGEDSKLVHGDAFLNINVLRWRDDATLTVTLAGDKVEITAGEWRTRLTVPWGSAVTIRSGTTGEELVSGEVYVDGDPSPYMNSGLYRADPDTETRFREDTNR